MILFAVQRRRAPLIALALLLVSGFALADGLETPSQRQFLQKLSTAAIERTSHHVRYDPAYVRIPFPGGDVAADTGVCTDEVIRAYRALGIDLQKEVHEDIVANWTAYPHDRRWQEAHPDTNIDHRRVPNLRIFFSRKGESLPVTSNTADYSPGGFGHVGFGRQHTAHRNSGGPQSGWQRALRGGAQHRRRTPAGGRAI